MITPICINLFQSNSLWRKALWLFFLFILVWSSYLPQVNGQLLNCTNAIPISCGESVWGNAYTGTDVVESYSCGSDDTWLPELPYVLTLTEDVILTITLTPMDGNFNLYLLNDCDETTCLASSENFRVVPEQITYAATSGTYYIVVDGTGGFNSGNFVLSIDCRCDVEENIIFEQNFETGIAPMTLVDNDGLTPNADVSGFADAWTKATGGEGNSTFFAASNSWYNPPGQSDDWMISPQISIPANASLKWSANSAHLNYRDAYEVRISTTGAVLTDFTDVVFSTIAEEVIWVQREVDLSAYSGQDIYIAWRNVSNDKYLLLIDDIKVTTPISGFVHVEMTPKHLYDEYTQVPLCDIVAPLQLQATVKNTGSVVLTNVQLQSLLYEANNLSSPIVDVTSIGISLNAGEETLIDNTTLANYMPNTQQEYMVKHILTQDQMTCNGSSKEWWVPISLKLTEDTWARDNGSFEGWTGLTGATNGVYGQNFTLFAGDIITEVYSRIFYPTEGDQTQVVIYNTDAFGKPTTLLASSDPYTFTADDANAALEYYFPIATPTLNTGTYFIGLKQFNDWVGLVHTPHNFTPNTAWLYSDQIGDWITAESYYGKGIAFQLRPKVPCGLPRWYVNETVTTSGDGSIWENAFKTFQEALDVAAEGDEIWVAAGTYLPTKDQNGNTPIDPRNAVFYIAKDIKIYGGFPNSGSPSLNDRDVNTHITILSGDLNGDDESRNSMVSNAENAYTILHTKNVSEDFLLDGFHLKGGNANGIGNNPFSLRRGGAWYNDGSGAGNRSNPLANNCTFSDNKADLGGAMYNNGDSGGQTNPSFTNCSFLNNFAVLNSGVISNNGGGGQANPHFSNCTFSNNTTDGDGGIAYDNGNSGESSSSFTQCIFSGNEAILDGGVLYGRGNSGGIAAATFVNCLFYDNTAIGNGGVLAYDDGDSGLPSFFNCTFYNNTAASGGVVGLTAWDSGQIPPSMTNCIVWNNSSIFAQASGSLGALGIQYSLLQDESCPTGITCDGNTLFDQNPLFTDAANADFTIPYNSPAVNVGTVTGSPLEDLVGNNRIGVPDMGAFEGPCSGTILYVNSNVSGGRNDGLDWANAFSDLDDALAFVSICGIVEEIWVAAGTYLPSRDATGNIPVDPRTATFYFDSDIKLYGGFPNTGTPTMEDRAVSTHTTILSGDLNGDDGANFSNNGENVYTILHTRNVSAEFLLDGFYLTGANANVTSVTLQDRRGGAWFNNGGGTGNVSNPTVKDCHFFGNAADLGGVIYNNGSSGGQANPSFSNCTFNDNFALLNSGVASNNGSGGEASPNFTNCVFSNNMTDGDGAITYDNGNSNGASSSTFFQCIFSANTAAIDGGVVYARGNSGGTAAAAFVNCLFYDNSAGEVGGVLAYDDGDIGAPAFTNCTFYNNIATSGGVVGIDAWDSGQIAPTMTNCIAWNNSATFAQTAGGAGALDIQYALIQENICPTGASCDGNTLLNQDPLFTNPIADDFTLMNTSPALDAGNDAANMEAFDLAGNNRLFETFAGGMKIDMGAYELQEFIPLAIADMDFQASLQNNQEVLLKWQATEINKTTHFVIEKSADGLHFEKLQIVESTNSSYYTALDKQPFQSFTYYRIAQHLDNDEIHYSVIRSVRLEATEVQVYPNPASDRVRLVLSKTSETAPLLKVFLPDGRLVKQGQLSSQNLTHDLILADWNMEQSGHYYLELEWENKERKWLKLVVF